MFIYLVGICIGIPRLLGSEQWRLNLRMLIFGVRVLLPLLMIDPYLFHPIAESLHPINYDVSLLLF